MKLTINKLARILKDEKSRQYEAYAKDDYYYRYNLGYLVFEGEDDTEIRYEIRGFKFNPKRYLLHIAAVNWTHHAGTVSVTLDWKTMRRFRYEKR